MTRSRRWNASTEAPLRPPDTFASGGETGRVGVCSSPFFLRGDTAFGSGRNGEGLAFMQGVCLFLGEGGELSLGWLFS